MERVSDSGLSRLGVLLLLTALASCATLSAQPFIRVTNAFWVLNGGTAVWGDFDNDGRLDVFASRGVYRNQGNGTFTNVTANPQISPWVLAVGDYDNDGHLDFLVTGENNLDQEVARLYHNRGDGTIETNKAAVLAGVIKGAAAWADFDNDGRLDLLITGGTNYETAGRNLARLFRNNGNGTFSDIGAGLPGVELSSVDWGDYDNDGRMDFVVTGGTFGSLRSITRVYHNNGDGTFTDIAAGLPGVMAGAAVWGDYDNDGYLDILLTGSVGTARGPPGITRVYHNNRDGTFTDIGAGLPDFAESCAAWGDFNNDGYLDILIAGLTPTRNGSWDLTTRVYVNRGDGTFADLGAGLPGISEGHVAWGDYNNDGRLDILWSWDGSTEIYSNNLGTSNTPSTAPTNLAATVLPHNNVVLRWSPSTDKETTNSSGLRYNLRMGTSPEGIEVFSPHSDLATGWRRIQNFGNAGSTNFWFVSNLPRGTYYWSVQAIDTGLAGSPFAAESSFVVTNDLDYASNHAPVADSQSVSLAEDNTLSITLTATR